MYEGIYITKSSCYSKQNPNGLNNNNVKEGNTMAKNPALFYGAIAVAVIGILLGVY
jgi:hypothetical protein